MASNENQNELLLRYLDGSLDPNDQAIVADLLREDAGARAFLRGVAEQAVVVADVERIDQHKPNRLESSHQNSTLGNGRSPLRQHLCCWRLL